MILLLFSALSVFCFLPFPFARSVVLYCLWRQAIAESDALVGGSMPAQLVSLSDGPSILVNKPILLIGRHPECDIQIDSRKVSRRHCCVAQVADYLVVRDLGSTNGIRINGVRVLEGKLKESDELTIGGNRYQVTWDVSPRVPARSGNAGEKKPEPRVPAPAANEDELLEACEEPVPLADAVERPARFPAPIHLPPVDKPSSRIIPENLDLASASGLHGGPPASPISGG
jgi:pSer/pThr/pTyr-binding forkhead associated (FHA) protein